MTYEAKVELLREMANELGVDLAGVALSILKATIDEEIARRREAGE